MKLSAPSRADVISGLVVTVMGVAGLVESWRMPRFENRNADPFTVPGLTPGLISIALAVLGLVLVLRALSNGGAKDLPILHWTATSAARTAFTLVTVGVYGFFLFGQVPFLLATALFIFVFTVGAELLNRERRLALLPLIVGALVLSVCVAFTVRFVFVEVFLVRFPG